MRPWNPSPEVCWASSLIGFSSSAPHLCRLGIVQRPPSQLEVPPSGPLEGAVLLAQHPLFDDGLQAQKRTHERALPRCPGTRLGEPHTEGPAHT